MATVDQCGQNPASYNSVDWKTVSEDGALIVHSLFWYKNSYSYCGKQPGREEE